MLTEKQKNLLIKFQDQWSILDFSFDFNMTSEKVYNEYSKLIESGEYLKYWEKKKPRGFVKEKMEEANNVYNDARKGKVGKPRPSNRNRLFQRRQGLLHDRRRQSRVGRVQNRGTRKRNT